MTGLLIGRPNVGKSTVFNSLCTHDYSRVSNYSQATVSAKKGKIDEQNTIYDLPGIYSLNETTEDQKDTISYLNSFNYDYILFVFRADECQQNIDLLKSLKRYNKPIIVVITYADLINNIDKESLKDALKGNYIIYSKGKFKDNLIHLINNCNKNKEENFDKICQCFFGLKKRNLDEKLDRFALHPLLGSLLLLVIFFLMIYVSFTLVGDMSENLIGYIEKKIAQKTFNKYIDSIFFDLIFPFIETVVSLFLPLFTLYFFFGLLEDSGYLSRIECLFEPLMRRLNLSGKSIIAYLLGTGCLLAGIHSLKNNKSKEDKRKTMFSIPYIICGAKLPVIIFLCKKFYPTSYLLVVFGMLLLSLSVALFMSQFYGKSLKKYSLVVLPSYKIPSLKLALKYSLNDILRLMKKLIVLLFSCSLIIYFLTHFSLKFHFIDNYENSLMNYIGTLLVPVFSPIGISDSRATISLLSGLLAKEQTLTTLTMLCPDLSSLSVNHLSFIVFFTLYNPCVSTYNCLLMYNKKIKRKVYLQFIIQLVFSYIIAFIFYAIQTL